MIRLVIILLLIIDIQAFGQVHTTYLWHLHQPTYWGETSSSDPNRYQMVKESQDLKMNGGNIYADGLSHPLNNLEEIFGLADRVNAYQYQPHNAVQSILSHPNAGAQLTYGGSLMENINSLGNANQWGYSPNWKNLVIAAHNWQTSSGKPRLDLIGFTMHHTLSPLVSDEVLRKEIQAHKYYQMQEFGYYSNGYWPAEAAFTERIIKVLNEEDFQWTIVANSHLARTLSDYPLVFGTNGCNIDPPNLADKVETQGLNWHEGQIDGRGGQFAAPYCFTPHKAIYIDPETGTAYKITIVPMADLDSYMDGFSQQGIGNIQTNIVPYADANRPPLVLLAHDGDNAWGGGASYYGEAVPGFTNEVAGAGYTPTTIEQYLSDYPVPTSDVVKVEDGSWFNAANDWGSPQFINWLWPLNMSSDKSKFNPDGWTEDVRNMAVLYAGENYCKMAEELEGTVNISQIVSPSASASHAERAWHFLLPGYDSGNAYYGLALDLEIKATLATNKARSHALNTIDQYPGTDNTKPSVLTPQRYPYNPGEIGFGPNYGYQQILNDADFAVWTLAYDVSGIENAFLKYRIDGDGINPLDNTDNDTYVGGSSVGNWESINMTEKVMPVDNVTNNPEADFFMLPDAIANMYYAYIEGISNKLVDYYIEIIDTYGNMTKTKIHHVWVGENLNVMPTVSFDPENNYSPTPIDVSILATDTSDPNPLLYYTTDGTEPDTNSTSAVSNVVVPISETTTFKVFAVDNEGNASNTISKTYYIGSSSGFSVYFKPPSTWGSTIPKIHYWSATPTGAISDTTWPGIDMTPLCDGWYSYSFNGVSSIQMIFNNGNSGVGTNQTSDLIAGADAWYDWDSGWLPSPPTVENPCLSIDPTGGTFTSGTNVQVNLTATDTSDPNPIIYYTLDGNEPTTSSSFFVNTGILDISDTITLKVFAQNNTSESSSMRTENYVFTDEGITVYFKPDPTAAGWNGVTPKVYYWNVQGGSISDASWPGENMQVHDAAWFKYHFPNATSLNVIFNNGNSGVGSNQTENIEGITSDIWYEWGVGLDSTQYLDQLISVYPNPTNGVFRISSSELFSSFELYDALGRSVLNGHIYDNEINISHLNTGIYFLFLNNSTQNVKIKLIKN